MFAGGWPAGENELLWRNSYSQSVHGVYSGNYNVAARDPWLFWCLGCIHLAVGPQEEPTNGEGGWGLWGSMLSGLSGGLPTWQCHRGHEGPWIVCPLCPVPVWFWPKLSFASFFKSLTCCEVCCLRQQTSWVPGMILCDRSAGGRHSGQSRTLKAFSWASYSATVVPR